MIAGHRRSGVGWGALVVVGALLLGACGASSASATPDRGALLQAERRAGVPDDVANCVADKLFASFSRAQLVRIASGQVDAGLARAIQRLVTGCVATAGAATTAGATTAGATTAGATTTTGATATQGGPPPTATELGPAGLS